VTRSPGESARPSWVRHGVLAFLCAAAALAYAARSAISVPAEAIRSDLHLSEEAMGSVMSIFFLGYALFQVPGGWLGQVAGNRRTLTVSAAGWSLAAAVFGLASSFWLLAGARLVMGVAQAGLFPSSMSVIAGWLPMSRRALACGFLAAFMGLGGFLGTALMGWLLRAMSWREASALLSLPGILWAAWFFLWFRERPEEHARVNARELEVIRGEGAGAREPEAAALPAADPPEDARAAPPPWRDLATSLPLWLIYSQQFFRAAGAVFFVTWFPAYLQRVHGVPVEESAYLSSLPLLAQVAGSLAGGAVCDLVWSRTGSLRLSRQGVAVSSSVAYALSIALAYLLATGPVSTVIIITLGHLLGTLTGPCAYAITIDVGGRHVPTVFGAMNMCGNLGAAASPAVLAFLASRTSWEHIPLFLAALQAATVASWLLLDPRRPVFAERGDTRALSPSPPKNP
jgi:MFS family permease